LQSFLCEIFWRLKVICCVQIHPEQALAAAEARMELHELNVWKDNLLAVIEQPREEFKSVDFDCTTPRLASFCNSCQHILTVS